MTDFQPSWDDLRALEALERLGTVRAAARETRLSISTFYRRVAALEAGLGRVCLNRRAEEATLTPFGLSLAQLGRKMRTGLTEVFSQARAEEQVIEGVVSLTTVEALVPLIEPALVKLTSAHPGLSIELHPADNGPSVRRREVDVALGIMQRPPEGCWGRRVGVLEEGVFGTAACVKSGRRWVLRGRGEASSPESAWEREHVKERPTFRAPFHTMVSLCVAGAGLVLMPRRMAAHYGLHEAEQYRASTRHLHRTLWCLTHPDLSRSPRVRALFEALAAQFAVD
ncbi:MAG: LysR family transcriptional regulator [Myxococcota bacterium]